MFALIQILYIYENKQIYSGFSSHKSVIRTYRCLHYAAKIYLASFYYCLHQVRPYSGLNNQENCLRGNDLFRVRSYECSKRTYC